MRRKPTATGFYPGNLKAQVDAFLDGWTIPDAVPKQLTGAVVPHAGWAYSGRTAARAFHALTVRSHPTTYVIFASVHVPGVRGPTLFPEGVWETPVGDVEVDDRLAARLLERFGDQLLADTTAHEGDHAIEVQLPFIRLLSPGARVVPVAMPPEVDAAALGEALGRELAKEPRVAVVCSTDLTHYGESYHFTPGGLGSSGERWMRQNDARMIQKVKELAAEDVIEEATRYHNACGPGGLAVALAAARTRGAKMGYVLEYTTSHRVAPAREPFCSAVGYLGAVF